MKSGPMEGRGICAGWLGFAAFVFGAFLLGPSMQAEEAGPAARAVRLSFVEGQVRLSQNSQVLADPAIANAPLFEGSQVATAEDGRAEIQFEDGSVARLSPNTSISLKVLRAQGGSSETEIVLESGLAYFELQGTSGAGQMRIRFGQSVATASGSAVLRIDEDNPPGELAVFSGNAHLERGSAQALDLHGGESVVLKAADLSAGDLAESIEPDSWDAWNDDRDRALQAESSSRTAATKSFADSSNPAWADLDAYGNWYDVPDQGYVWSPNDAGNEGWDPYGNGNWMWTPQYGYIWVSGDPWGYMPFQCGSWNYYDAFGWGWAPGMGMCQPWWSGGGGWGLRIGLAPGGYRFPQRPHPRPGPPRGPIRNSPGGEGKLSPHPLVAVNRRPPSGSTGLPGQNRNAEVTIAGHTVQPLRPLAPRPRYDRPVSSSVNRSQPAYQGTRPPSVPSHPANSVFGGSRSGNPPAPRPSGGSSSHASAPSHAPSGGGSSSHSSGSSGGGSSHSGGGSGGGGGSHSSGGSHH